MVSVLTAEVYVLGKSLCARLWGGAAAAVSAPWPAPGRGRRLSDSTAWVGESGSWVVMPEILHRLSGEAITWLGGPQIRIWFSQRLTLMTSGHPPYSQDWGRRGITRGGNS